LKAEPGLYKKQFSIDGFEWVDLDHRAESVIVFKRKGETVADDLLIILNMTPVVRNDWEIYVTGKMYNKEIFNSDEQKYWGTGDVFNPEVRGELVDADQQKYKLIVNLPALAGILLK
jgi:1,4-alpha-glucan branching enzyme